jgi:hypothetical protein
MPVDDALDALQPFGWDFEGEGFELTLSLIADAIRRFIVGTISAVDLEDWANAIECREDIEFEAIDRVMIASTVHHLANPILQGDLTVASMTTLLASLELTRRLCDTPLDAPEAPR